MRSKARYAGPLKIPAARRWFFSMTGLEARSTRPSALLRADVLSERSESNGLEAPPAEFGRRLPNWREKETAAGWRASPADNGARRTIFSPPATVSRESRGGFCDL